jgi:hypothetical protein
MVLVRKIVAQIRRVYFYYYGSSATSSMKSWWPLLAAACDGGVLLGKGTGRRIQLFSHGSLVETEIDFIVQRGEQDGEHCLCPWWLAGASYLRFPFLSYCTILALTVLCSRTPFLEPPIHHHRRYYNSEEILTFWFAH